MRREAGRYEGEALTDPLTGLPNRRRLERYIAAMVARGERAVIGVCDLDGFKAVNTRHGHHSGDLVLQRIAGVINRVMRRGDFVARYGGDEFVVVLPGAGMTEAAEVARRIDAAVRAEDWESLVPGTPVGVSIGFAEVSAAAPGCATRSASPSRRPTGRCCAPRSSASATSSKTSRAVSKSGPSVAISSASISTTRSRLIRPWWIHCQTWEREISAVAASSMRLLIAAAPAPRSHASMYWMPT